jgi:hypothetical protein
MDNNKPESLEEKRQSFLSNPEHNEAWIYVWELKLLLDKLLPDDWVTPNLVHNLAIDREGEGCIGYVDLHHNAVYFNNGKDYEPFSKG